MLDGKAEIKLTGCVEVCAAWFCPIFKPQRPQNLENGGSFAEQRGHGKLSESSLSLISLNERFPQRPQNFTPSANLELQFVQATIPGIRLEGAALLLLPPSCDGEGWLAVP